jgi:hypothetical protein
MSTDPDLDLLQKWAPVFKLHPDEEFFPCSIPWFLQQTRLLDATGKPVSSFNHDAASLARQRRVV